MHKDDMLLWPHLNRTDVPWDLTPNVAGEHEALVLSGRRNGTHSRVVEQKQFVARGDEDVIDEGGLSIL